MGMTPLAAEKNASPVSKPNRAATDTTYMEKRMVNGAGWPRGRADRFMDIKKHFAATPVVSRFSETTLVPGFLSHHNLAFRSLRQINLLDPCLGRLINSWSLGSNGKRVKSLSYLILEFWPIRLYLWFPPSGDLLHPSLFLVGYVLTLEVRKTQTRKKNKNPF